MRTASDISHLTPLEEIIRHKLIPLLRGRDNISDEERHLLALLPFLGGMGIVNPVDIDDHSFECSETVILPLVPLILERKY